MLNTDPTKIHLPKVIASSVVRASCHGQSHGGVYLIDMGKGSYEQVIDWDDTSISWVGNGGERGLRGIALRGDRIYLASHNRIFVYNKNFKKLRFYENRYLGNCHEIFISGSTLFVTSTAFNSILEFDLVSEQFRKGYYLRRRIDITRLGKLYQKTCWKVLEPCIRLKMGLVIFDPDSNAEIPKEDIHHINSVYCSNGAIYFSGTASGFLLYIKDEKLYSYAKIPLWSHNATPFLEGTLLMDTAGKQAAYLDRRGHPKETFPIKRYREDKLLRPPDEAVALPGWGRGLAMTTDGLLVAGSSPATVSVYRFGSSVPLKSVNITMDVRNTIHGLEIWQD